MTHEEFLDLVGATNLIPGPNSTEMAIHIGFMRAGWTGLIVGGASFILSAVAMVLALAWTYMRYGSTPQAAWLMAGIKPVVIAIILQALRSLGKKAVKSPFLAVVGAAVVGLYFLKVNELLLLLAGGIIVMGVSNWQQLSKSRPNLSAILLFPAQLAVNWVNAANAAGSAFSLPLLFLTFLKIGSILYGSGYVLLAFLQSDLVNHYGWLTSQQLLDAVAVGQVTPGPVFTTATFIGYMLGGVPGGLLATLGIFLPSFVFVAISNPLIPKIRNSYWVRGLLDGVNVASLGLMAAVTWVLGWASLVDPVAILTALAALILLLGYKINTIWLIAGGALIGYLSSPLKLNNYGVSSFLFSPTSFSFWYYRALRLLK